MLATNSILFILETQSVPNPDKSAEQPRDHEFETGWTNLDYYGVVQKRMTK